MPSQVSSSSLAALHWDLLFLGEVHSFHFFCFGGRFGQCMSLFWLYFSGEPRKIPRLAPDPFPCPNLPPIFVSFLNDPSGHGRIPGRKTEEGSGGAVPRSCLDINITILDQNVTRWFLGRSLRTATGERNRQCRGPMDSELTLKPAKEKKEETVVPLPNDRNNACLCLAFIWGRDSVIQNIHKTLSQNTYNHFKPHAAFRKREKFGVMVGRSILQHSQAGNLKGGKT